MREKIDMPALPLKEIEIRDRRFAAGQDDEIGERNGFAGANENKPHAGLHPQRIELVEIGDPRQHEDGDRDGAVRAGFDRAEAERVFSRQAPGRGKVG
jgi:hypothetical protein